jgi:hypothetical protein
MSSNQTNHVGVPPMVDGDAIRWAGPIPLRRIGYVPIQLPSFRTCSVFRNCNNPNGCGAPKCHNAPKPPG